MRDDIAKLRERLANKDNETSESIRQATSDLQQTSLKLFEAAYKKMSAENAGNTGSSQQQEQQQENKSSDEKKN